MSKRRLQVTLGGLMAGVVVAGVLAWALLRAQQSARRSSCISNLRQVASAKASYALEYGGDVSLVLTRKDLAIYIKDIDKCYCPSARGTSRTFAGSYSINALTSLPTCKSGLDEHRVGWGDVDPKAQSLMPDYQGYYATP
jgi:hypothetical protein